MLKAASSIHPAYEQYITESCRFVHSFATSEQRQEEQHAE
jgi:hypothetical protein